MAVALSRAVRRREVRWLWPLGAAMSVAAVLVAAMPFGDFQDHPHWARVRWIPFLSPPVTLVDCLLNVALFVPVGYLFRQTAVLRHTSVVVVVSAILSATAEYTQVYSHARVPSVTDVCCNVIGAVLGAVAARRSARTHR